MKRSWALLLTGVTALAAGPETKVKLPNNRADLLRGEKLLKVRMRPVSRPERCGRARTCVDASEAVAGAGTMPR